MKVAACYSLTEVRVEDLPLPVLERGDILVRVEACGLCGSDISKLSNVSTGVGKILGHEMAGEIVDRGPQVRKFAVGQRIAAGHHTPCFNCHFCRRGSYSMCAQFKATYLDPGGFAEFVRVPAANVEQVTLEIPHELTFEEGSFAEPLACCLRALSRSPGHPGDTALVLGLGSIGLLLLQIFKAFDLYSAGADLLLERLDLARKLGADLAGSPADAEFQERLREQTQGRGPDLIITATDSPQALVQALSMVRDGGTVNLFGGISRPAVEVDMAALYRREITLMASYSSSPLEFPKAMELLRTRQVRVAETITHRFPLQGLGQAIDGMIRKTGIKNMILPQQ